MIIKAKNKRVFYSIWTIVAMSPIKEKNLTLFIH